MGVPEEEEEEEEEEDKEGCYLTTAAVVQLQLHTHTHCTKHCQALPGVHVSCLGHVDRNSLLSLPPFLLFFFARPVPIDC